MLGNTLFRHFSKNGNHEVFGTLRNSDAQKFFPSHLVPNIRSSIDMSDSKSWMSLLHEVKPDIVINCVGIVKQLSDAKDPLVSIPINSLLPHQIRKAAEEIGARVIHVSTDCVFSGRAGNYTEGDFADADDLYGRSKFLGELREGSNALTLRTSIIGHELQSNRSLVDWFLAQESEIKGFKKAIFSGLPTIEVARVIEEFVFPKYDLNGLYHLSVQPISKFDLLNLVGRIYGKTIKINPDEIFVLDRSLDSTRFQKATGYVPPSWEQLIKNMYSDYKEFKKYV